MAFFRQPGGPRGAPQPHSPAEALPPPVLQHVAAAAAQHAQPYNHDEASGEDSHMETNETMLK